MPAVRPLPIFSPMAEAELMVPSIGLPEVYKA